MKMYKPEELKNVDILYEGEYFIPIESYKLDNRFGVEELNEKYLISNFGRIYSFISNKCMLVNSNPGKAMVTFNCLTDTLSVIRLMVYNFNREAYNPHYNYYIIDKDKPITIDNITNEPPTIKKQLTEDQKQIFIKCRQRGMRVREVIDKYNLPYLAAMRFNKEYKEIYGETTVRNSKRIRKTYDNNSIDIELSHKFEDRVDGITRDQLKYNKFTDIISDICKDLGVPYTKIIYNRCYQYLNGHIPAIKIYKEDTTKESSTTSL